MRQALSNCGNHQCDKCIHKGDSVWKHDGKLYCHIKCFLNTKVGVEHGGYVCVRE